MNKDRRAEFDKIAKDPKNRRLYRLAIGVMVVGVIILFSMLIWFDEIPIRTMLFMRGCVGLCAIVSVIIAAVFFYNVYSEYHKQPRK